MMRWLKVLVYLMMGTLAFNEGEVNAQEELSEDNEVIALNYHRVRDGGLYEDILQIFSTSKELSTYSVTAQEFENQIKWLKDHRARFLTEKELLNYKERGAFPPRSVWINFDDMDYSVYKNAHPILKKYQVPATGFVISGKVGVKNFNNMNLATTAELQEMRQSGLWEFGSHTHDVHELDSYGKSLLIKLSQHALTTDLLKSNDYLSKELGMHNKSIAYPFGQFEEKHVNSLKKAGIQYGYTLEERPIHPDDKNYYIPRILISTDAFKEQVKQWDGFKK